MDRIARASTDERRLVFEAAAQRMALAPAAVEKDFWVCYTLDHLFHRSGFAESMVFKGGTSLSKAFGLIERFSEDIDLILDWRLLGYGENEPWEPRSNSAQERFKADSIERTNAFLADAFVPKLRATLSESLGTEASVRCGAEKETVYFDYPRSYESAGTLDTIKLEIGPMAAWSPSEEAAITPYAADVVPFGPELSTTVRTASPERTFWEKATILHQEANRPEGKAMPRRYSRHYYDMYRLGHSFVLGRAVAQPGLLVLILIKAIDLSLFFWSPSFLTISTPQESLVARRSSCRASREVEAFGGVSCARGCPRARDPFCTRTWLAVPACRLVRAAEGRRDRPEHVQEGQLHRQRRHRAGLRPYQGRVLPRKDVAGLRVLQGGPRRLRGPLEHEEASG